MTTAGSRKDWRALAHRVPTDVLLEDIRDAEGAKLAAIQEELRTRGFRVEGRRVGGIV